MLHAQWKASAAPAMKPQDDRNHDQGLMSKAALEKQLRQLKKVSDQPVVKKSSRFVSCLPAFGFSQKCFLPSCVC